MAKNNFLKMATSRIVKLRPAVLVHAVEALKSRITELEKKSKK